MENFNIPQIPQLEYCGQKVLTTPQIAALLKCKRQNITDNFKNHKTDFVEGVDYFFLKSEEFRIFRQNLQANGFIQPQANGFIQPQANGFIQPQNCPPFAKGATNVYLWTESGFAKLAKFIGTNEAKLIYSSIVFGYFQNKQPQVTNFTPPQIAAPKIRKTKFKENLTFEQLQFLIEHCTNEKLRDELIKRAAGKFEPPKCVYILAFENGIIKIGVTQDFRRRAREIIAETGFNVVNWCHTDKIPAEFARDIETALFEKFESAKVDGEFFKVEFETALNYLDNREEISESMNF